MSFRRADADGWFVPRSYPHFDVPITTRVAADTLVRNFFTSPRKHRFLPLIAFERRIRRWRKIGTGKQAREAWKIRSLAYCSNADAHIFAAIGTELSERYEKLLSELAIDKCVVGYRKGISNITVAAAAFPDVRRLGSCATLALDLKDFFPSISHSVLKQCWRKVMGGSLPLTHYLVFKALTRFSYIERRECLTLLGIPPSTISRNLPRPICSLADFQRYIRGLKPRGLVEFNRRSIGIPQGTPISGIAANVAMLEFDLAVHSEVTRVGGVYRRYSDDILVICQTDKIEGVESFVKNILKEKAGGLQLNAEKRNRVDFFDGKIKVNTRSLQYLGFTFDGNRVLIRPSTISRYYGRMRRVVKRIKYNLKQGRYVQSPKGGRDVVQLRKVIHSFTHLGRNSLLRTYVRLAKLEFGATAINHQFRGHRRRLSDLIK